MVSKDQDIAQSTSLRIKSQHNINILKQKSKFIKNIKINLTPAKGQGKVAMFLSQREPNTAHEMTRISFLSRKAVF